MAATRGLPLLGAFGAFSSLLKRAEVSPRIHHLLTMPIEDSDTVRFLQWALPRLGMRWPGFRKVRRQVGKRIERRMAELGLEDVSEYRTHLESQPAEWSLLDGFCRISISRFCRDRMVFEYLADEILPSLAETAEARGAREVRAWSAGCASGEEAYSIVLAWRLGPLSRDLEISVLASDSDETLLERARAGAYRESSLKDMPREWIAHTFSPSPEHYILRPCFREGVTFTHQDIRRTLPSGQFDLILCRNLVFTYFEEALQGRLLERLLERLLPGGAFAIGKRETLPPGPWPLVECRPKVGVYRKIQGDGGITETESRER